jgi:hypothetical protein
LRSAAIYHILTVASLLRRLARGKSSATAIETTKGVTVLGEILEIASFVGTPLGAVLAIGAAASLYFFGRWVLAD